MMIDIMDNKSVKQAGLYIHVPFCLSKCPYCDFYSVPLDSEVAKLYADRVVSHLKKYKSISFDTVYFGGGTPILLYKEISDILQSTDNITADAEITVEANPCCTDREKLEVLLKSGVNRISFGLQSGVDSELMVLGRRHNASEGKNVVLIAYDTGFTNISADIMIGTPNQTPDSLMLTLDYLTSLPLTHISSYMLKIEQNTPYAKIKSSLPNLPDEDMTADYYLTVCNHLESKGFSQYEISNYAKSGYESRHNLKYWRCEEYIGIGPSAHSYYDGKRFAAKRDLQEFLRNEIYETYITDENPATFSEWAMLYLRLREGLSYDKAKQLYNVDRDTLRKRLEFLPKNLYRENEIGIRLTKEGFLVSNSVIAILTEDL